MPPEHNLQRDRQLEALRRYVSDLTVQPERVAVARPLLPPVRPRRRSPWPRTLLTLLLMVVALAGGMAIGANRASEQGAGAVATTAAATAGAAATPECVQAVEAADKSIGHALEIESALREHTVVMNALLDGKIDRETALATGTASLIAGSGESAKFDLALADYKKVVDSCKLRVP